MTEIYTDDEIKEFIKIADESVDLTKKLDTFTKLVFG